MKRQEDASPKQLLEEMGRSVVPVLPSEREALLQRRVVASVDRLLEGALERRAARRGRVASAVAVAAAAILVISLAGARLFRSGQPAAISGPHVVTSAGLVAIGRGAAAPVPASAGFSLARGDELFTSRGAHARLSLADRAAVEVSSETRLRVASPPGDPAKNELLELVEGEVSFSVPKLASGSTLSVRTADALVTVRGTRFTVGFERGNGGSSVTRVSVADGRVEVESRGRTVFLTRGERWSSVLAAKLERSSSITADPGPASESGSSPPTAAAHPSALKPPRSSEGHSTLAEENRVYQEALRSSQSGDSARSLALLETLLQLYPHSPLTQSARVEHFRVLLQTGNITSSAREARRYLSEYPAGFARAEARQIVLRGLGDAD